MTRYELAELVMLLDKFESECYRANLDHHARDAQSCMETAKDWLEIGYYL